jgi:SAM-dependent methyltransferase
MPQKTATEYDNVLYPGHPHETTHIARLATLGALYGMDPNPIARAHVLELGCGNGGNLIPMAFQYPDSQFIGIDLSQRAIEHGLRNVATLGLPNVELRHCDIMDVTATIGAFDYIIAHGVYSWVPQAVRTKILEIFATHLSAFGIGYLSYNAYPGSHFRNLTRDAMLYHVSNIDDPINRVGQARALLKMLSEASAPASVYNAVLKDQAEHVQHMPDELLFHDDLAAESTPFLLHKVVADANAHGLQYLSDAVFSRRDLSRYPEGVRTALAQFPDKAFLARDQYQDFIDGFGFRRTLLCRSEVPLNRSLSPGCLKRFHLASSSIPLSSEPGLDNQGIVKFRLADGSSLATDHPLSIEAFIHLGNCWPASVSFPLLLQKARDRMAGRVDDSRVHSEDDLQTLLRVLFNAACSGQVEFYRYPVDCTTVISERPKASLLSRKQAETGTLITSLRHEQVRLEDERVRRFLLLVDGTRNIDELVADLRHETADLPLSEGQPPITPETIKMHLEVLAKLGLLLA